MRARREERGEDSRDERLRAAGVRFTQEPVTMGDVTMAVLDDTRGNLIQIVAAKGE